MHTFKKVVAAYYSIVLPYKLSWLDIVLNTSLQKLLLTTRLLPSYRMAIDRGFSE